MKLWRRKQRVFYTGSFHSGLWKWIAEPPPFSFVDAPLVRSLSDIAYGKPDPSLSWKFTIPIYYEVSA